MPRHHRNARILLDANVFIDIAVARMKGQSCPEFEKMKREHQYLIKSTRLLKHYVGVIANKRGMRGQPLLRIMYEELRSVNINDNNANRHEPPFRVSHSRDRFLYGIVIEAKGHNRHQVILVSNDPDQTTNSARMLTHENIPIVDAQTYVDEYCQSPANGD